MRLIPWILLVALGAGAAGCSRVVRAPDPQPPGANQAAITFLRAADTIGSNSITLYDVSATEIAFIGLINPGTKVAYPVKPGVSRFMVITTGATDFLELNAAPGKTYYSEVVNREPSQAFGMPRVGLRPVRYEELGGADFRRLNDATGYVTKGRRLDVWYKNNADSIAGRRDAALPAWQQQTPEQRAARTLRDLDGR